jgi:hypothetical protein
MMIDYIILGPFWQAVFGRKDWQISQKNKSSLPWLPVKQGNIEQDIAEILSIFYKGTGESRR